MLYCVSCKSKTADASAPTLHTTPSGRSQLKSTCAECGSRKSQFASSQGGSGQAMPEMGRHAVKLALSQAQKQSLADFVKQPNGKLSFRLTPQQLMGADNVILNSRNMKKYRTAQQSGKGFSMDVDRAFVKQNQQGGFIVSLLGSLLAPAIESTMGHILGGDGMSGGCNCDSETFQRGYGLGQKHSSKSDREKELMRQMINDMTAGGDIGKNIKDFFTGFIKGFTDPIGSIKMLINRGKKKPRQAPHPAFTQALQSAQALQSQQPATSGSGITFY